MPRRRFGHLPDPEDKRDRDIDMMGLASVAEIKEPITLRKYEPPIFDQRSTNSCVGQSFAGAVAIVESRAGLDYDPVSRLALYYNSRRLHKPSGMLFDMGTYIRTCAKGMYRLGAPPEELWPFTRLIARTNRRPSLQAYMRGHGRRGGEYFKIQDGGDQRVLAIASALAEGYPVVFGTRVTESFLPANGPHVVSKPDPSDRVVGGHAMVIVGVDPQGPDGLVFDVRNSWGEGYRDNGHVWMTEDYVRWIHSRDFTIVRGWDRIRKAA